jgi:hypothetical protein
VRGAYKLRTFKCLRVLSYIEVLGELCFGVAHGEREGQEAHLGAVLVKCRFVSITADLIDVMTLSL